MPLECSLGESDCDCGVRETIDQLRVISFGLEFQFRVMFVSVGLCDVGVVYRVFFSPCVHCGGVRKGSVCEISGNFFY